MARLPLGSHGRRRWPRLRGDPLPETSDGEQAQELEAPTDEHEVIEDAAPTPAELGEAMTGGHTDAAREDGHNADTPDEGDALPALDEASSDWFAADPPFPEPTEDKGDRPPKPGRRLLGRLARRGKGASPEPAEGQEEDELGLSAPAVPPAAVTGLELVKRFGTGETAVDALRGVTVSFAPGTFSAIMGPSGSGKSTLMHILAGLDRPTGGEVELAGRSLSELGDHQLTELRRSQVGFVFQAFNLVPVLSAEENIALPLSLAGRRPDRGWVDELLDAVDLSDRRTHRPAELSGGQQQAVAIARSLVTRPAVVFADEPTGNLDSESTEQVLGLLRRATTQFGQTVVLVTHDPLAAAKADRVLFLEDGRIVRDAGHLTAEAIVTALKVG
ncbi:MAG: ABC transporter ATP-binding protein [Actinobacteria bacterium]|nr:MAG: ABC transporter ATP-binding protein [Actinomycetota bacterium]